MSKNLSPRTLKLANLSYSNWLNQADQELLLSNNTSTPRLDAELILSHVLGVERISLHAHPETILSNIDKNKADKLLRKRSIGYPIAYIVGHKDFFNYSFTVSPSVLIPRPETEELVATTLKLILKSRIKPIDIIDVGCGPGTIGLTLALELKKLSVPYFITLSDISKNSLKICHKNRSKLGVLNTKIIHNNLLNNNHNAYDIIIANLPYVATSWKTGIETKFEPQSALFSDANGLGLIYRLIKQVSDQKSLRRNGWLVLESDPCQQKMIAKQLELHNFKKISHADYVTVAQY